MTECCLETLTNLKTELEHKEKLLEEQEGIYKLKLERMQKQVDQLREENMQTFQKLKDLATQKKLEETINNLRTSPPTAEKKESPPPSKKQEEEIPKTIEPKRISPEKPVATSPPAADDDAEKKKQLEKSEPVYLQPPLGFLKGMKSCMISSTR